MIVLSLVIVVLSILALTFTAYTHSRRQDELIRRLVAGVMDCLGAQEAADSLRPLGKQITRKEITRLLQDHIDAHIEQITQEETP